MRDQRPTIYNIPAHVGFSDCLADGLLDRYDATKDDPLRLARVTLLLPTRRAVRSVREALLRRGDGKPMLLPAMLALGDLGGDEEALESDASLLGAENEIDLPPAISPLRRQFLLSRLILKWASTRPEDEARMTPSQAMLLAKDLMVFMDQAVAEEVDLSCLPSVAPERFAVHWQDTVRFLDIVIQQWPAILETLDVMDGVSRRIEVLKLLQSLWQSNPPANPIIAAGSTGSVPSTARLLSAIARLPAGAVILPGLDREMEEETFAMLDAAHPQFGMKELLISMQAHRAEVETWKTLPEAPQRVARERLINEALRSSQTTDFWQRYRKNSKGLEAGAIGLNLIELADAREEAATIAMIMRHGLEVEGQTVALISPDQFLARRVEASLKRWGINVDTSAGRPLEKTVPAIFLRTLIYAVHKGFPAVPLLSLLKHPLCSAGMPRNDHLRLTRLFEIHLLRGPRIIGGLDKLSRQLSEKVKKHPELEKVVLWFNRIVETLRPLVAEAEQFDTKRVMVCLVECAEKLAQTDQVNGEAVIWQGEAGENLSRLLAEFLTYTEDCPDLTLQSWPDMFDSLLAGKAVRPQYGTHPRLFIWGPLEARLQRADIVILGGLNEGVWPQVPDTGPWLSRPMSEELGLLPPERRLGLSGHDFFQGACAPKVYLTRAQKVDGEPKNPSRWLLRLQTLLETMGHVLPRNYDYLDWAKAIDRPEIVTPAKAPEPRPPVEVRPRSLSVTRIGEWTRDPYGIYARKILGLTRLDDVDADPGPLERGNLVHNILESYLAQHERLLRQGDRDRAVHVLLEEGQRYFAAFEDEPAVQAFWWSRFQRIAPWFVDFERSRPHAQSVAGLEIAGEIVLDSGFRIFAYADRIDRRGNHLVIYDYKTGNPPSGPQVKAGFQPQLPLEALIAAAGKFDKVAGLVVEEMAYLKLSGGAIIGEEKVVVDADGDLPDAMAFAEAARRGVEKYVRAYEDPMMPYLSRIRPQFDRTPYDYDHLARVKEWQEEGGDD